MMERPASAAVLPAKAPLGAFEMANILIAVPGGRSVAHIDTDNKNRIGQETSRNRIHS